MSYLPANPSSSSQQSPLDAWLHDHLSYPETQLRCRLRGNILNVLYEGDPVPDQQVMAYHVVQKLNTTDINALNRSPAASSSISNTADSPPPIYQVWLYGRSPHQKKPDWTFRINLDQIGHYLHHFTVRPVAPTLSPSPSSPTSSPAPPPTDAATPIARHLSETLNHLGVSVAVRIKERAQPAQPSHTTSEAISFPAVRDSHTHRMLVFCRAAYSPSPSLIAEPIARQLRSLNLTGFKDAILSVKVQGEEKPEWSLRIDLTPPDALLEEWAQWGDVEAIHHLVNRALEPVHAQVLNASIEDAALHLDLDCPSAAEASSPETADRIQVLLDSLSPQGIQSVVLRGYPDSQDAPGWIEHRILETSHYPDKGDTPLTLARQGNLEAIAYLLSRLLNPDLNAQLETGGIRVQLLKKDARLHVMCSAIVCPPESDVAPNVIRFLRDIHHPNMGSVRIYGRRSGVRAPLWSRSEDFAARPQFIPSVRADSASDAYVQDLINTPADESPLREDLTSEELLARWARFRHKLAHRVRRSLLTTQLVALTPDSPTLAIPSTIRKHGLKTAAVWAAVGLLAVVQVDWLLGALGYNASQRMEAEEQTPSPSQVAQLEISPDPDTPAPDTPAPDTPAPDTPAPDISAPVDDSVSVVSELTSPDMNAAGSSLISVVPGSASDTLSAMQTELLSQSPYPTFNSNQLDLKLAMYYQHVAEFGPPDVLVIGSSRALRGIDPVVLEDALTDLGHDNADVFNFGINGATAQVVELVVYRILDPAQLPKLILWADGARAFNGGREDRTYQGIAASEGYELLSQGELSIPSINGEDNGDESQAPPESTPTHRNWVRTFSQSLTQSYEDLDDWLSDRLATVSTAHPNRDAIKSVIQDGLTGDLSEEDFAFGSSRTADHSNGQDSLSSSPEDMSFEDANALARVPGQIGIDGFLPLEARFDPVTYYETYARVPGNYDQDYANFQLAGRQAEALQTLLQLGDTHDVPIVFINLPLTEEYLDPYRLEHEQEFRQHLLSLDLTHEQFIFRDMSELWLTESDTSSPTYYQYFSDPSHLNQHGAVELSRRIAEDPMIPWQGDEF